MNANTQIALLQPPSGRDELGQPVVAAAADWPIFAPAVFAERRTLSGSEARRADAQVSFTRVTFRIGLRPGVTTAMRVREGSAFFEIKAVLPDNFTRRHIDLVCEAIQ